MLMPCGVDGCGAFSGGVGFWWPWGGERRFGDDGGGAGDLRELVRLPDVLAVCSSTGWTYEKHMRYLRLMEKSFVSRLHDSGCSFKGLFGKQILKCTDVDQGCLVMVEGDRAKSCIKVEHTESPYCGNQEGEKAHSVDDDASATELVEETTSHGRATSCGQSSTCYIVKHIHSPSRTAGRL